MTDCEMLRTHWLEKYKPFLRRLLPIVCQHGTVGDLEPGIQEPDVILPFFLSDHSGRILVKMTYGLSGLTRQKRNKQSEEHRDHRRFAYRYAKTCCNLYINDGSNIVVSLTQMENFQVVNREGFFVPGKWLTPINEIIMAHEMDEIEQNDKINAKLQEILYKNLLIGIPGYGDGDEKQLLTI